MGTFHNSHVNRLFLGCALVVAAMACGKKFDGSSPEAFNTSLLAITSGLPNEREGAVTTAISTLELSCRAGRNDTRDDETACAATVRGQLNGKTLSSLHEQANAALESYAAVGASRLAIMQRMASNPRLEVDPEFPSHVKVVLDVTNSQQSPLVTGSWNVNILRPDGSRYQGECARDTCPSGGIQPGDTRTIYCSVPMNTAFPGRSAPPDGASVSVSYKFVLFLHPGGPESMWLQSQLSSVADRRASLANFP